jgi:phosphatidylethanolamine/phosphatidyl-N-methylethanolamine N-methyltransferase
MPQLKALHENRDHATRQGAAASSFRVAEQGVHPCAHADGAISRQGVIRAYRRYAPIYDWLFGASLAPGRRAMATAVHGLKARSVLEVGVGTGLTLPHYPAHCRIVGIDLCEQMLYRARNRAMRYPERRIELESMDAENMSFADGSFDCVTVPYVLSVTPNPAGLISEVRRVCRTNGTILIVNHFTGSRFWRLFEDAIGKAAERVGFRSSFDFDQHIAAHDWEILSVRAVNVLGLSRMVTIRNV